MSKTKEKRIKRLRKYSLWPQFIEAFIVEVAFVIAVTLVFIVDMIAENHNLVTVGIENTNAIVEDVGKGWDLSNKSLSAHAEQELNNFLKYDGDTFKSVNIVDDDFNVLALYGNNDINHSYFLRDFDPLDFNKNGFYFSDGESDFSIKDPDIKSIKLFFTHFV